MNPEIVEAEDEPFNTLVFVMFKIPSMYKLQLIFVSKLSVALILNSTLLKVFVLFAGLLRVIFGGVMSNVKFNSDVVNKLKSGKTSVHETVQLCFPSGTLD